MTVSEWLAERKQIMAEMQHLERERARLARLLADNEKRRPRFANIARVNDQGQVSMSGTVSPDRLVFFTHWLEGLNATPGETSPEGRRIRLGERDPEPISTSRGSDGPDDENEDAGVIDDGPETSDDDLPF